MKIVAGGRTSDIAKFGLLALAIVLLAALVDDAFAQGFTR